MIRLKFILKLNPKGTKIASIMTLVIAKQWRLTYL
jgi:hypothetical protein